MLAKLYTKSAASDYFGAVLAAAGIAAEQANDRDVGEHSTVAQLGNTRFLINISELGFPINANLNGLSFQLLSCYDSAWAALPAVGSLPHHGFTRWGEHANLPLYTGAGRRIALMRDPTTKYFRHYDELYKRYLAVARRVEDAGYELVECTDFPEDVLLALVIPWAHHHALSRQHTRLLAAGIPTVCPALTTAPLEAAVPVGSVYATCRSDLEDALQVVLQLADNAAARHRMSAAARQYYLRHFSPEAVVDYIKRRIVACGDFSVLDA